MTARTLKRPFESMLLDTNIWLDYYQGRRRQGHACACELLQLANQHDIALLYAITTSKDLFYVLTADFKGDYRHRHEGMLDPSGAAAAREAAWACLAHLDNIATAVGSDQSDIWLARAQRQLHDDYEDNLVIAAAQRARAGCFVTNDEKLLRHSPTAALSCEDAIAYLRGIPSDSEKRGRMAT